MGTNESSSRDNAVRSGYLDRLIAENNAALKAYPNDPELRAERRRLQAQKLLYQPRTGSTGSSETPQTKREQAQKDFSNVAIDTMTNQGYGSSAFGTLPANGQSYNVSGMLSAAQNLKPGGRPIGQDSAVHTYDLDRLIAQNDAALKAYPNDPELREERRRLQAQKLLYQPRTGSTRSSEPLPDNFASNYIGYADEEKYRKNTDTPVTYAPPKVYTSSAEIKADIEELYAQLDVLDDEYWSLVNAQAKAADDGVHGVSDITDFDQKFADIKAHKKELKTLISQLSTLNFYFENSEKLKEIEGDPINSGIYTTAKVQKQDEEIISALIQAVSATRFDDNYYTYYQYVADKYGITQENSGGMDGYVNALTQLLQDEGEKYVENQTALDDAGYKLFNMAYYEQMLVDAEEAAKREEANRQFAQEHPVVASIGSILASPLLGLEFISNSLSTLGHNNINDLENYVPMNSYNMAATNFVQAVRSQVSEDIEKNTDWTISGQNVASFLYQTGMSIGDSALMIVTTGPASVYFMGASAAAAKQKDILDNGGTNSQAIWGGLAAGAAEVIFEKISVGNLLEIKNISGVRSLLNSTVKQAGVEASEEMLTSIANIISDAVILGQNSDYNRAVRYYASQGWSKGKAEEKAMLDLIGQVALSSVGGLFSGGIMGGTTASFSAITSNAAFRNAAAENQLRQDTDSRFVNTNPSLRTSQEQAVIDAYRNAIAGNPSGAIESSIEGNSAKNAEASYPINAKNTLTRMSENADSGTLSNTILQSSLTTNPNVSAGSQNPIVRAIQERQRQIQQAQEN